MDLKSKLTHKGLVIFTVFYLVAGIGNIIILVMNNFNPPHVALVALLSLISAIGIYRLEKWSLWLVVALFFIVTTYGSFMLNFYLEENPISLGSVNWAVVLMWTIYLLLTWVATIYVVAKRGDLK
ncbi:hypothetical protein KAX01_03670 [Candidatus Bathyarchaeota archaeon]|nr:hypothetical protein [Candidatus Bathyarchaeota archaeon]